MSARSDATVDMLWEPQVGDEIVITHAAYDVGRSFRRSVLLQVGDVGVITHVVQRYHIDDGSPPTTRYYIAVHGNADLVRRFWVLRSEFKRRGAVDE